MSGHETIADIVAEKRARANKIETAAKGCPNQFQRELIADLRRDADRLDAAAKREKAQHGNAAAMYSCLLKILAEMTDLGGMETGRKACFSPDAIADEIRQALSVPPRNCDVYTHDEALEVWAAEKENERNGCFDEWLYHVATERKGECDGR